MRLFLQGNLASRLMEGSMKEGEELEHPWLNRSIESAQKKVEQQNYSSASACCSTTTCSTSSARSSTASATARSTRTGRRTSFSNR
jgi:hypothetical protein